MFLIIQNCHNLRRYKMNDNKKKSNNIFETKQEIREKLLASVIKTVKDRAQNEKTIKKITEKSTLPKTTKDQGEIPCLVVDAGSITIFEDGSLCCHHMSLNGQIICGDSDRRAVGAYLATATTGHLLNKNGISEDERDRMNRIIIPNFFDPKRKKEEIKELLK
jgi:hypothetical protein